MLQTLCCLSRISFRLSLRDRIRKSLFSSGDCPTVISTPYAFVCLILAFLTYGASSFVKTLNYTSFHLRRIVGIAVEILAGVGEFSVNSGGQCLLPDAPLFSSLRSLCRSYKTRSSCCFESSL
jgi:hypothetical protein